MLYHYSKLLNVKKNEHTHDKYTEREIQNLIIIKKNVIYCSIRSLFYKNEYSLQYAKKIFSINVYI